MTVTIGTSGYPPPQLDSAPAADPHVQSLVAERNQLASINDRLRKKLNAARNSLGGLAQRMEGE